MGGGGVPPCYALKKEGGTIKTHQSWFWGASLGFPSSHHRNKFPFSGEGVPQEFPFSWSSALSSLHFVSLDFLVKPLYLGMFHLKIIDRFYFFVVACRWSSLKSALVSLEFLVQLLYHGTFYLKIHDRFYLFSGWACSAILQLHFNSTCHLQTLQIPKRVLDNSFWVIWNFFMQPRDQLHQNLRLKTSKIPTNTQEFHFAFVQSRNPKFEVILQICSSR